MAEDSVLHSGELGGQAGHRLASIIIENRDPILASFEKHLESTCSPVLDIECAKEQVMIAASEVITDIAHSVCTRNIQVDEIYKLHSWALGEAMARSHLSPADSLRTAVAFFRVTVAALTSWVGDDPELLPVFVTAILALNESSSLRIREAIAAYTGSLLNRVHRAHLDERHRIARELHDRLGEGFSVALRQLELDELLNAHGALPSQAAPGKEAIVEGMRRLRLVVSDLRQDPVKNLEKALTSYVESIAADANVQLRVSGDETWASPAIIDETYIILREALRNALKHGSPRLVLVRVEIAPHELRASVDDDGCGFSVASNSYGRFGSTGGIASMHERADLIGGRLRILSGPGSGTHVELLVKLSGHHNELAH